ncbi:MAG: glycosyltransferase family 4 protein, partial [Patescibacteria group bacterium]
KWQKVCYGSGILPNIKKNKLLIFVLPFLFIFQFFALIKIIRKEKIDLINAHWVLPSGLTSLLVARIFNKLSVLTTHGSDVYTLIMKKGIIGFISRYVTNKVNQITATSTITAKLISKYSKIDENKIKVISMGVDTNYFYPSEKLKEKGQKFLKEKIGKLSNSPLLLYVGSLSIHKGVNYLIKAMPKILKKYESANLLIIGNGQQEDNLKKLSYKLGVNQNVHFIGSIKNDELPYYYNSADVFVLASLREGLPVVLMEAMSSGCPVVATNIAGNPDIIDNGKNGFLIKIKSPKEISQAVIKILSDEDLKNRFIKNARKTIKEKYDWQIIANKFKTIFNST